MIWLDLVGLVYLTVYASENDMRPANHIPQNCNRARSQHHPEREVNREVEPPLREAAEDEAVCYLRISCFRDQNGGSEEKGEGKTYEKHISGPPLVHVRPLDLSDSRDEPI